MPKSGKFRGVFHKNRAGVGSFEPFLVHKNLLEKLTPYEGKFIELEVFKARQAWNPGTSVIQEIGAIKELPVSLLQIEAEIVPSKTGVSDAVDVVYRLKNTSKEATKAFQIRPGDIQFGISSYQTRESPDEVDDWLDAGYTNREIGFVNQGGQVWDFITPGLGQNTQFLSLEGRGGRYPNSGGKNYRLFSGNLVSNEIEIEVV